MRAREFGPTWQPFLQQGINHLNQWYDVCIRISGRSVETRERCATSLDLARLQYCYLPTILSAYSSHTCGATHLHLPSTMCATNGFAGRLEEDPITGQEAIGHGSAVGGCSLQQSPVQP